ncbi:helix-turn-helix domain-containing protein [Streptomyces sp. MAR4 CNX-425]|uniref:helix-turn-helix domain-containing protein n=1 Tax=Streptomyces sp. MAR4 CNX-425 TaxID=3406343 RepID=UPI003B4FFE31
MRHPADDHIGARIADYRKIRHLTQQALAQQAHLSRGYLARVESGLQPATPAVVAAVARPLQVDIAVLNGQPYLSQLQQDHLEQLIAPLSDALDMYDLGPDPEIAPRSLAQIAADVDSLCARTYATEYKGVGTELPGLLSELTTAMASVPDAGAEERRAATLLSWCYWVSYEFAYRLGYHQLATIALERMGWMAERAQDPLLLATRLSKRSSMLLRRGDNRRSLQVLERGHRLIEAHDEPGSPAPLAVAGSLHLAAAIAAAQAKNGDEVKGHMELARKAADRIGREVPQVYWSSFGAASVGHFEVATLVELGQLGPAVQRARQLHFPAGHPKMRVGRYHIEMARAYTQMGRTEAAQKALRTAREVAPQQARYHPLMRETVGALVRRQRRASEGLTALAAWVGM